MSNDELPVGLEQRIRGLMDVHETLLAATVVSETEEGMYVLVVREWPHPNENVDASILSERYAYLTKGKGNDGWVTEQGATAINRRDTLPTADLATGIAQMYAAVAARQRNDASEPHLESLLEG